MSRSTATPLARWIALLCVGLVAVQVLTWAFLGLVGPLGLVLAALAGVAIVWALAHQPGYVAGPVVGRSTALSAAGVATAIILLGGGGGLFYANVDWQVRNAVLRDLFVNPWPFAYDVAPVATVLRAPIGIYLVPALAGKWGGPTAADWALVAQNAAFLAMLLALAGSLFADTRRRIVAVVVFWAFSGLDVIGTLAAGLPTQLMPDRWNVSNFCSNLDEAFATPQHALAGWMGAVLYLLWHERRLPLVALLTPLPLLAIWSPLGVMGTMPFAAYAAWRTLAERRLRIVDVALPAIATLYALPSLLYLASGSGSVGGGTATLTISQYVSFEVFEVGPYVLAVAMLGWRARFGGATLAIVIACLLLAPLLRIGEAGDFTMRASITPLAILCVAIADALAAPVEPARRLWRVTLFAALIVGSITPVVALYRAVTYPPRPDVVCGYYGVVPAGYAPYVAPLGAISHWIAPTNTTLVTPHDPRRCWTGPWPNPYEPEFPERVAPEDRAFPQRLQPPRDRSGQPRRFG